MIKKVIIDKEKQEDVARTYGLKRGAISSLLRRIKKQGNYMQMLIDRKEEEELTRALIQEQVDLLENENSPLLSVKTITTKLKQE